MGKPLRIAVIRQRYTPFGGAERFVENALNVLQRESSVELTLITRKWNGADNPNVKKIICNPFYIGRLWRDWSFARCACRVVQKMNFDLVQSHERVPCGDIYRAGDGVHKEWLRQRKKIIPAWKHWITRFSPYHQYLLHQEQQVFEGGDRKAIIAISNMVEGDILRYYTPAATIHTILNSVDLEHFHPKHRNKFRQEILDSLGLTKENQIILFVGSGFHRKGLLTLLNTLPLIQEHIHLVVIGKDKNSISYKKISQQNGTTDRVHFIGPIRDPVAYYVSADLFTFPTFYEPFSNSVLEAMASGLPAMVSNTCGAKDLVTHGQNGQVLTPDDVTAWAVVIEELLENKRLQKMRQNARNTAEQQSNDKLTMELMNLYKTIL